MNNNILVSILVPVYNVEKVFEKCLSTIFSQTYKNIEYVFVDDKTPDNSMDILTTAISNYNISSEKVIIIHHTDNKGIAFTRNDCIAHANGDYILFVDSDDWIEPDMVERLVSATKCGEIDLIACDYFIEEKNGKKWIYYEKYGKNCQENMRKATNYEIFTILWKMLIRKELFDNISFTPGPNVGEDYIATIKLFYHAKSFYHLSLPLYHYSQLNDIRYSNINNQNIEDHILAANMVEAFFKNHGIYDKDIEHRLNIRKFNIKKYFLNKNFFNCDRYNILFPEANEVWREIPYSKKEKIKFWMAEKKLYFILKIINYRRNNHHHQQQ
jgi:glycosyltransferase involved in cell wall biosynthesis